MSTVSMIKNSLVKHVPSDLAWKMRHFSYHIETRNPLRLREHPSTLHKAFYIFSGALKTSLSPCKGKLFKRTQEKIKHITDSRCLKGMESANGVAVSSLA